MQKSKQIFWNKKKLLSVKKYHLNGVSDETVFVLFTLILSASVPASNSRYNKDKWLNIRHVRCHCAVPKIIQLTCQAPTASLKSV